MTFHPQSCNWVIEVKRRLLVGSQCPQADCKTRLQAVLVLTIRQSQFSVNSIRLFYNYFQTCTKTLQQGLLAYMFVDYTFNLHRVTDQLGLLLRIILGIWVLSWSTVLGEIIGFAEAYLPLRADTGDRTSDPTTVRESCTLVSSSQDFTAISFC